MNSSILGIILLALHGVTSFRSSLVSVLGLEKIATEFILVNVWSPFCEPCGAEVEILNKIDAESSLKQKLTVLGVSADGREREIKAFLNHFKPHYQQATVTDKSGRAVLGLGRVPTTILFDLKRNIIKQWSGKISASEILAAITSQRGIEL